MNYGKYNDSSRLFPNQATSGRDNSLYPKKNHMLIGTSGYTERDCDCEDQSDVEDIDIIVNLVLEQLKKDGAFDDVTVDETKIVNNVIKHLQDNGMLTPDIDEVVTSVIDKIKDDKLFIGPKGDPGEDGAPGADGKDGVSPSASDIATELKSDTDFVASLKGDKGDKGDPGADGAGGDTEEVVQYLLDNGYIVETKEPTKEEVIDGLVDTIETAGYMKDTASNDTLIETAIDKLIADNKITLPTNTDGSDSTADFKANMKAAVFSKVGTLANYKTIIDKLVEVLSNDGYYNDTVPTTEADDIIAYLRGENLIEYQAPNKKQEIKDFLTNSTIFDDSNFNINNTIPVAIQQLKDAGLLGSSVNVQDVSDAVSGDLKDNGFLNGYAKETYVDTAVKDAKDKAVADLKAHTEAMKEQIKKGYQNILDEDIGYLVAGVTSNAIYNINDKLTIFPGNPNTFVAGNGKITIDSDGYIELKAGRLYLIHPCIMVNINGGGNDVGYCIDDKKGNRITPGNLVHWAEIGKYSDNVFPEFYIPTEDCAITITLFNRSQIYQYNISVLEIKQPVITEVSVGSYVDHVGLDCQDSPVGNIISFMGNTAPKHYLVCDGTEYNITDYPELANHFIKEFGTMNHFGGDGITTFAVPDLRGEFLRGTGTNSHINQGNGSNVGNHQNATEIPFYGTDSNNHKLCHYYNNQSTNPEDFVPRNTDKSITSPTTINLYSPDSSFSVERTSVAYNVRPTNTSVMYCIKYESTYVINYENSVEQYSYDEHTVGFWVDGKTLYEKVINVESVTLSKSWVLVSNFDYDDIDTIISIDGSFVDISSTSGYGSCYSASIFRIHYSTLYNGFVMIGENGTNLKGKIIVRYTKK